MKLTKRQAQVISVYTGYTACKFEYIQEYAEELIGRSLFTHELASVELSELLKKLAKPEFISMCYGFKEWKEVD